MLHIDLLTGAHADGRNDAVIGRHSMSLLGCGLLGLKTLRLSVQTLARVGWSYNFDFDITIKAATVAPSVRCQQVRTSIATYSTPNRELFDMVTSLTPSLDVRPRPSSLSGSPMTMRSTDMRARQNILPNSRGENYLQKAPKARQTVHGRRCRHEDPSPWPSEFQ
jgi:hypothetical protein